MKIKIYLRPVLTHLLMMAIGVLLMLLIASSQNKEIRAANEVLKRKTEQLEQDLRTAVSRGVTVEAQLNLCLDKLKKPQLY